MKAAEVVWQGHQLSLTLSSPAAMIPQFTTRTPAVPDVFVSGRNVVALRPRRRVGFRSVPPGLADDICWGHIIFVMPTALILLKIGPNSKRGK